MDSSNTSQTTSEPSCPASASLSDEQVSRLAHTPNFAPLTSSGKQICDVKRLTIRVHDDRTGPVRAFLHVPQDYLREKGERCEKTAAILLSGADGGLVGPSSMYPSIADKMASLVRGIPVMRLDYRYPANMNYCVPDVLAAMEYLENKYVISRFVLVGWSFGGALVSTVGGSDKRVIGCAMVASQLAETAGIKTMAPRSLLLMHGTDDRTMRYSCSQELYEDYGEDGEKELKLFEGDDHVLTEHSREAEELLCDFIMKCAGEDIESEKPKLMQNDLRDDEER